MSIESLRARFLRGLIGTSLVWGVAWSAVNAAVVLAGSLPSPPEGVSRAKIAYLILRYQAPTTFAWGCVLGIAFSLIVVAATRRWPTNMPLRGTRLIAFGAIAGLAVPSVVVGFGSLLNVAAIVLCGLTGAGIGTIFARVARGPAPKSLSSSDRRRLPST